MKEKEELRQEESSHVFMRTFHFLSGHRLASAEDRQQRIGISAGIPILGLDALSSAAYGPEAALTLLISLGAADLWTNYGSSCIGRGPIDKVYKLESF